MSRKVKKLVWESMRSNNRHESSAFGINAFYLITGGPGRWVLKKPDKFQWCESEHKKLIHAKIAAQLNYERRVNDSLHRWNHDTFK